MTPRLCLVFVLLLVAPLAGQAPKSLPGDAAIERYLKDDVAVVSENFLKGAKTLAEWQKSKPRLKQEYFDMLGLWPLPEKTPLKATLTGTVVRGDVVIEKLHYQSRPGLYVTGNLYRPKAVKGKRPAILYLCGHSSKGRDGNKTAFQDHGMWFARNGYVCLLIDTLQLGEIAGKHHGTYNLGRWWWHSLAYTSAGVECWNGVRAIDYLVGRPDVDAARIGVTGISGGGAATFWIAAADERVKVAVPVSGMSDLESYVNNKVINGHCDCMFLVNTYRWEWTTIAALIAPRPLLFANSDNDRIFPMDGNRRIIARLRRAYKLFDKPDLVDEHVSKGGHDYRPDLRVRIFGWFNVHLKGDKSPVKDADDLPLPGKELRVFAEDADLPKDAINARIDEEFIPRASVKLPDKNEFAEWKKGLIKQLRERSFRTFPERIPAPKVGIAAGADWAAKGGAIIGGEGNLSLTINPPVLRPAGAREGLLILLNEDEDENKGLPAWAKALVGKREVQLLSPRGVGKSAWTRKSPPNYVERAHALLGRTVDQGRVWDAVAAVRWLQGARICKTWGVAGRGQAGVLAAYAALFEPTIAEVVAVDPPASHRDGPYFLGVQRVLDVPEAFGLLAPLPLKLMGAKDGAFERTVQIYKLAGASARLKHEKRESAGRPRIDPAGIRGELLLCGGEVPAQAIERFLAQAGGEKARVLVLTAGADAKVGQRLRAAGKGAAVEVRPFNAAENGSEPDISRVTGVWLAGSDGKRLKQALVDTALERGIRALMARGGIVAASGAAGPLLARIGVDGRAGGCDLLPDAVVAVKDDPRLQVTLKKQPALVGYEIGDGAALVVRGRRLSVVGEGKVTIHLAPTSTRPARSILLKGKIQEDLTALRRSALARSLPPFPPAKPPAPVVAGKGALIIVGGAGMPNGLIQRFVDLAGGKKARIVTLPIAGGDTGPARDSIADAFRKAGAEKVTVLKARRLAEVESKESLEALAEATGIWFGGGRQWRFVDAYEGTKALPLMFDVLRRGGVIGGSSAGATIQGDYLCRGGVFNNFAIRYEGYERGLAFLPGVAIDQHFTQRKRQPDMTSLMKVHPQLLGIGLDEATAIIVRGQTAEVVGRGKVHFYNAARKVEKGKPDHESLADGERYDLKERKTLPAEKEKKQP